MKRAGLDLDNVIYDWELQARYICHERWALDLAPSTYYNAINDALGPERWRKLMGPWGVGAGLWKKGCAIPGALDAFLRIRQEHLVVIITKRPRWAIPDTFAWLQARDLFPDELIVMDPGDRSRSKAEARCDWYIDDAPDNVEDLARQGARVYLFDRPWNQDCNAGTRVRSWSDALKREGIR